MTGRGRQPVVTRASAVAAIAVTAVTGCGGVVPVTPTSSPAAPSSPTTRAGSWGPLAVIREDAEVIHAALGGEGRLRIGEHCVTLEATDPAREITLVWRGSQTEWDPLGSIHFEDRLADTVLELADGVDISIGGAGASRSPWVAEPDPSCPRDRFVVHTVDVRD
jgi:hypothetical protein